ncbi:hypothetical protein N8T08_006140 [Aspergillus melleus]|uniref:Uncharacterized protein n=1 Tax=Aspergillus melleus TaxID=138277 RepID=A0ACC3B0L1_9EURO|nr:hypothetical protein N8T08_006140 [Aspergillus melleus]
MILADYWPQGSGSILVTSRDPLAKSMFTRRPSGLDLGPLSQQDSLDLFNHLTSLFDEAEDDTAKQISGALGGVPLAISQMAGIIRRQDLTLSEFLELYTDHEEHASLYETKFDTNITTYRHSLSTVWAFEKLKPQARQLLELISFLDPDVIGEDLLVEAAMELLSDGGHFRKSSYIEARTDLLQSSLVQRDKQKQQVSVHRIVQDVILATMDVVKKQELFDKVVRILWAGWPSAMPKPSKDPELPQPKSTDGRLSVGTSDERLYLAYAERGISRIQDKRYEEGEADLKEALSIRKALRNYVPRSGEANLSWALLAQGKLDECNTLLLESLAGREKALGKNDRDSVRTGLILYVLGNLRAVQDQWEESFLYHQRAWHHMCATVGDRDFYTATVAHKIAQHLVRMGRGEEAISMINGALDVWSVDPNAHKNEIARSTFLKAKVFEATGKAQKASISLRVATRLRKEITKEDKDPKTLTMEDFDDIVAFWAR